MPQGLGQKLNEREVNRAHGKYALLDKKELKEILPVLVRTYLLSENFPQKLTCLSHIHAICERFREPTETGVGIVLETAKEMLDEAEG